MNVTNLDGVVFRTLNTTRRPAPYHVFLDEDLSRINDRRFRVDVSPNSNIQDRPATCQRQWTGDAFADGHAAGHSWAGSPADRAWLKEHTTELP